MKYNININIIVYLMILKIFTIDGASQGTFQNLGFESTVLGTGQVYYTPFDPAFPGWNGTIGNIQQTYALYNDIPLASSQICIIDRQEPFLRNQVIAGNFTAILMAGVGGDTTLSQTGLVPQGTRSLRFAAFSYGGLFTVSLGGQTLSLQNLGTGPNYTFYGADITGWAGQNAQLTFNVPSPGTAFPNSLNLDAITFSTQIVPEPSVYALGLIGLVTLWGYRKWDATTA